jgi:signal peptidase I
MQSIVLTRMSRLCIDETPTYRLRFDVAKERKQTSPFLKAIFQCIFLGSLAIGSYFLVSHFILQKVQVVGVIMFPTLHDSQQYVLNKWVFYLRDPERNDLVVLRDPLDKSFAVKRVVGKAGDHLLLKNGRVYINGKELFEPYLQPGTPTFPYSRKNVQSFTLNEGQYFVLGDNRKNSADSRSYGPVPRRNILGLIVP